MHIALLHTGQIHVATFDALIKDIGFEGRVTHRVEEWLLDKARADGLASVSAATQSALRELADADAVLCTCSTIGPLVEDISAEFGHVLRIDRPAMAAACGYGARPLVAICLESTRAPTLELLADVAASLGVDVTPKVVMCADAWPHFESGDMEAFAQGIADDISAALKADPAVDCVLLAQASMHVAQARLSDLGVPVLTTPTPAAQLLIETAKG